MPNMLIENVDLHPHADYGAFLNQGRFMLQRCRRSGEYVHYPRVAAPRTGSIDLEWVEASGRGVVYSTTVIRKKNPEENYNVALIDLEEGPRIMSRIIGIPPTDVKIGLSVRAEVLETDGKQLLVFRVSGNEA